MEVMDGINEKDDEEEHDKPKLKDKQETTVTACLVAEITVKVAM